MQPVAKAARKRTAETIAVARSIAQRLSDGVAIDNAGPSVEAKSYTVPERSKSTEL